MSTESLDTAGNPLQVPLLSVVTKPAKRGRGVHIEEEGWPRESNTFWTESLIATLCFFPFGLIAICASLEVNRWNNEGNFAKARKASNRVETIVKFTYGFSAFLYVILGLLVLAVIEFYIVTGIDREHTNSI